MPSLLVRRPSMVVVLIAGYFILEFLVRLAIPHGLRYDESQQAFFSQWLALGYDSQPPLYNWVQALVISAFGLSLVTIAAVKNVVLFLIYLSYYKLARLVLTDRFFAVIATLSLLTIPQLFWEAQRDLTHTVAQLLAINLFLYGVIRTLKAPSTATYAFTGVALGLGMLSKYNFALLAAAAIVAVWLHPQGRARLFDRRFLLTIAISLLIFLPHGLWLIHNLGLASGRTLGIMEQNEPASAVAKLLQGPLKFFKLDIVIAAPTLIVFALVFGSRLLDSLRSSSEWSRFFATLFIVIALLVLMLILAIGMTDLRDRWLLPFLFLLPIYLCLKLEASGVKAPDFARRFLYIPLAVMLIAPVLLVARVTFPNLFGYFEVYNVPYAAFVDKILAQDGKRPGLVLTNDWPPAGNLRLQLPDVPVMSMFFANLKTSYSWSADRPILLIWLPNEGEQGVPAALTGWLRDNLGPQYQSPAARDMALPYINGRADQTYHLGYAWVRPQ